MMSNNNRITELDGLRGVAALSVVFLGSISYSLYLIHQNIGYSIQLLMIRLGLDHYFIVFLFPFVLTILLSYFLNYYFEKPIVKYLNKKLNN